ELDGIICGHIHHAEIREIDGILYCNDGDWVESCTALVEEWDGSLRVVQWVEMAATAKSLLFASPVPAAAQPHHQQ
ncbi:MAG: UDP-2,3-diacylglucosamine hydrolase, partial [Thiothrix lacustris]